MKIQHTIEIAAPSSRVWEVTVDVEAFPDHTPTMTAVERLDPGPIGVGTRILIKQPMQRAKIWTVRTLEPERTFAWTTTSLGTTMTATHDLVPTANGTMNTLTVEIEGPRAQVIGRIVRRPIRKALQEENKGLKSAAEPTPTPPHDSTDKGEAVCQSCG